MNSPLRHVRRLHFTVQREEDARSGRTLMDDALRTASLGDEGRLFVVRSLALGKLSMRNGSSAWSQRIEERMASLRSSAVPVEQPAAGAAAVVSFEGPLEPWLRLAVRVVRNQPIAEWYWHAALPGWSTALSPDETLRLAFVRLAELAPTGTYVLARRLQTLDALPRLVDALKAEDAAYVFPAHISTRATASRAGGPPQATERLRRPNTPVAPSHASLPDEPRHSFDRPMVTDRLLPRLPRWAREKLFRWGERDPRSLWLVAALTQSSISGPTLPETELSELVQAFVLDAGAAAEAQIRGEVSERTPLDRAESKTPPQSQPESTEEMTRRVTQRAEPTEQSEPQIDRVKTDCGGLFFLVHLLTRTGFDALLLSERSWLEGGMAWKLFRLALQHARPGEKDHLGGLLPTPSSTLQKDVAWRALLRAHRLTRTATGLSLRELVVRPAEVTINETHVDVFFRSNQVDLRVRRAGLDLDPGWVPWLGRVVNFHYTLEN